MNIHSRTVKFYEVHLHTNSKSKDVPAAAQTPMSDLLPLLAVKIPAQYEIKYANAPIEVTQSRWVAGKCELHLLLNIVDPDRSDVSYRKRKAKLRRSGNKGADEDIEVSVHVVIRAEPGTQIAKVVMTTGAGIPPSKIVALLREIYKLEIKSAPVMRLLTQPLPVPTLDAKGKQKRFDVAHSLTLNGMPNGTLLEIIKSGKIVGAELIDSGSYALDSTSKLAVDRMQMHVSLKSASVDLPFLQRVLKSAKVNRKFDADKIRIEYTDSQVTSGDRVKSKLFNTAQLNEAFTRSETIELKISHDDHQSVMSEEIIQAMTELL